MSFRIFQQFSAGFLLAVILFVVAPAAQAINYVWTDGAGDRLWTSTNNWSNGIVPPVSSVTYVYFGNEGTNTVTSVNGNNFQLGLLRFSHPRDTVHTIDLDNTTMAIRSESGGALNVGVAESGISNDCGDVVFTNGTLQIGHGYYTGGNFVSLPGSISIGTSDSSAVTAGRGRVTVHGGFVTSNMTSLSIGYVSTTKQRDSTDSWLDLRDTTISSPGGENVWTMAGSLSIGRENAGHGELRLPASLEAMDIGGTFSLGEGIYSDTRGVIDFGSNSQFRALTVKGNFVLGAGGSNELCNWPRNVAVAIGTPEEYKICKIGSGGSGGAVDASLVVSNAPFTAFLNTLMVGGGPFIGTTVALERTGLLDLEHATTVQIGDTPNQVNCPWISVGFGRYYGYGTMRLPATVTALAADTLIVGGSRYDGILSFAPGSQLTNLVVREDFRLGSSSELRGYESYQVAGGMGSILGLPTNVTIRIGAADAPAGFSMGDTYQYGRGGLNILAPTNGTFSAHLSSLRMGLSRRDDVVGNGIRATLDLRETQLEDFVVYGSALIGSWTNTVVKFSDNNRGEGRLYLPTGDAEIKGGLYLGDTRSTSLGLLDLTGTRIQCGGPVEIGKTGSVIVRMQGESAGLDIASIAEDALTVDIGGTIHIDCFAPPPEQAKAYWGLRIAGDRRADLQTLVENGALTWDTMALPAEMQTRFRINYDERVDKTVVGLLARRATLFVLR